MKNINKLKNGKWQFEIICNGKRHRKNFSTKTDAITYASNYKSARKFDLSFFQQLSGDVIKDIKDALAMLPNNMTLVEAVDKATSFASSDIKMIDAWNIYLDNLRNIKGKEPKLRIRSFFTDFPTWEKTIPNDITQWLSQRGMPKTIKEYYSQLKAFFSFSVRRGFIKKSPMDSIDPSTDFPKIQRSKISIWNDFNELKMFFEFLKEKRPQWVNWFCIACFAGIRNAEINRLKPEFFDRINKTITMPYNITKTGDSWLMEDLPDNLWQCLDKYGYEIQPMSDSAQRRLHEIYIKWCKEKYNKSVEWKDNVCRHSFCTYHLSLHRNPAKTSLLLKHRNPDTMWQHYLAGLVDKETAKKYFEIIP